MNLPAKNKRDLIQRINQHQEIIMSFGVSRLGIFGSFARDKVNEMSDVDFFVEFKPGRKTFDNFMDLADKLEEITGRKVELVTTESLSKHFGKYILKEVEYVPFAA